MVFCGENCENLQRKGTSTPLLQNRCYVMWQFRSNWSVRFSFNGIFSQQHFKIQRQVCEVRHE